MNDENKTKKQLIDELAAMRQRVVEIEINHKRAGEALRESEERYRQLVEQPFDGVFVRSQDKILFMNKAGARILGVEDPSQFVGKSVLDFLHPDYREFVRKRVQEVYETGKFVPLVEEKYVRLDEKVIDVEVAATAFTYGGAPAVQVIFRDITERKRVEQELRKSREMLENITQGISDIILLISKDFRILWANKAALEAYGSEIVGDCCYKATHQSEYRCEPPLDPCPISELERTRKPVLMHHIHIDKHGNKRHVEVGTYPVMDEKGEIFQFIHVCKDVTERKRAEEALQESEERYRSILDNIEDGYFEVDLAGNFTFFNDSLCKIMGYSRAEMMGMNNRYYMDKETSKKVYQAFNRVYTTGKANIAFDYKIIGKDGAEKVLESPVSLIRNADGVGIGFRGIARNITERKRAEAEREQLVRDLQKALAEVKTLKGFFPICASCKKIRDDKGYWTQIEAYIRDHSEAEFSHGICPECMKKLYGNFFAEEGISKKE